MDENSLKEVLVKTLLLQLKELGPSDKKACELIAKLELTPTNTEVMSEALRYCPSRKFVKSD